MRISYSWDFNMTSNNPKISELIDDHEIYT